MDSLASPIGVLIILVIVTIAAFVYEPAKYVGVWREIATRYETDRRPVSVAFPGEDISLGAFEFAHVDAGLDDAGFWMLYNGPAEKKAPDCVLVPWDCIRFKQADEKRYNFQIRLKSPLEFNVSPELGAALQRRSQGMPTQQES
jgi:hypothetical protein